jgi:hypothetical protein
MARRSRTRRPRRLPERLHIDAFDDRIQLSRRPTRREIPTAAPELCEVGAADLGGICPLCTSTWLPLPMAGSARRSHVPHAVGGVVRTRTCPECNGCASASEAELVRWWAQAYPARFATPDLPGYRNAGEALVRSTTNGKFALIISGSPRSGVDNVLEQAGVMGSLHHYVHHSVGHGASRPA